MTCQICAGAGIYFFAHNTKKPSICHYCLGKNRALVVVLSDFQTSASGIRAMQAAMLDSIRRGEVPTSPLLLYPQVLSMDIPEKRAQVFQLGRGFYAGARLLAIYSNKRLDELSSELKREIEFARTLGVSFEIRKLSE